MILRVGALLACMSFVSVACKQTKDDSVSNSVSAGQQSKEQSFDGVKALATKLNSMTPADYKTIDEANLSEIASQFENIVAINAANGSDTKWKEVQDKLKKGKSAFLEIATKYPTIGDLRRATRLKDYKNIDQTSAAFAAWRSDMDAFPVDVMFPAPYASGASGKLSLLSDGGERVTAVDRVVSCALAPLFGTVALLGETAAKIAGLPSFKEGVSESFSNATDKTIWLRMMAVYSSKALQKACLVGEKWDPRDVQ